MKSLVFLFIFLFNLKIIFSQAPPVEWSFSLGGSGFEAASKISELSDGHFISCGISNSKDKDIQSNNGGDDAVIVKISGSGSLIWYKTFGGSGNDYFSDVKECRDKGLIICGSSYSGDGDLNENKGENDFWIVKTDSAGNKIWSKSYGGSRRDYAQSIAVVPDGGYIVLGTSYSKDGDVSSNKGFEHFWLLRLDETGNIIWKNVYGGSRSEGGFGLDVCRDKGFIMCGFSSSNDGDLTSHNGESDLWLVKVNASGVIEWQKNYGDVAYESGRSVKECKEGGFIIGGEFYRLNEGTWDYWVIKTDAEGNIIWEKKFGGRGSDWVYGVVQDQDGGFVISGTAGSKDRDIDDNKGQHDAWLIKLSNSGIVEWKKSFGGTLADLGSCVIQSKSGSILICGNSNSSDLDLQKNQGGFDYWVLKLMPPPLKLKSEVTICVNQTLSVSSNKSLWKLKWYLNGNYLQTSEILSFRFQKAGTYRIKASADTLGTVFSDSTSINVIDEPRSKMPDKVIQCQPVAANICLKLNQSGCQIIWNDLNTDSCRQFKVPGLYSVILNNSYCIAFDTIEIIEKKRPVFMVLQNDTPCLDGSNYHILSIYPDTFPLIEWGNGNFTRFYTNFKSDSIQIRVNGSNACANNTVFLPVNGCEMKYFLPNSFSPNNDGINDRLIVVGSMIANAEMQIFNRWGELLFSGNAITGWDGTYKGEIVAEGVYFIKVRLQSHTDAFGNSPLRILNQMVQVIY